MLNALKKTGFPCGRYQTKTLMKLSGVSTRRRKKFRVTTDSRYNLLVAYSLLNRNFNAENPNKAWISDIIYVWTIEGWLYWSVILDLYSRRIVGWTMSNRINKQLLEDTLQMAIRLRNPDPDAIFHSDRGSQYCSFDFQRLLKNHVRWSTLANLPYTKVFGNIFTARQSNQKSVNDK